MGGAYEGSNTRGSEDGRDSLILDMMLILNILNMMLIILNILNMMLNYIKHIEHNAYIKHIEHNDYIIYNKYFCCTKISS